MKKRIISLILTLSFIMQITAIGAGQGGSYAPQITAFALDEDVANQFIAIGSEDTPVLPSGISATIATTVQVPAISTPAGGIDPQPQTPAGGIDPQPQTPAGGIDPQSQTPAGGLGDTQSVLADEIVTTLATTTLPVEWILQGDEAFSTEKAAEFVYSAKITDDTYTIAAGVALPTITVVVGMPPMQLFGAPAPTSGAVVVVTITPKSGSAITFEDATNGYFPPSGEIAGVSYNNTTKTLTLTNADLSSVMVSAVTKGLNIVLDKSTVSTINFGNGATATLKVVGQNYITHVENSGYGGGGGIYLNNNAKVTVTGTGNINVSSRYAYAIVISDYATLTLADDVSITANTSVGDGTRARAGVQGMGNLTVEDDAHLKARGNSVSTGGSGIQLRNNNNSGGIITVSGNGKIEGWAGAGTGTNNVGNGIECRELTVSGGSVSGFAGNTSEGALPTTAGNGIYVRASGGGKDDPSIEQTGGKIYGSSKVNCGVRWHGYYDMQGGELVGTISEITDKAISSSQTTLTLGSGAEVWTSKTGASGASEETNLNNIHYHWHLETNYIRIIYPGSSATAPRVVTNFDDLKAALEDNSTRYIEVAVAADSTDINPKFDVTSAIDVNTTVEKHLEIPTWVTTTFNLKDSATSVFNVANGANFTVTTLVSTGRMALNPKTGGDILFNVTGGELNLDGIPIYGDNLEKTTFDYTLLRVSGGTVNTLTSLNAQSDMTVSNPQQKAKAIDVTGGTVNIRLYDDGIVSDTRHALNISGGGKVHFDQAHATGEVRVYGLYVDGKEITKENGVDSNGTKWFNFDGHADHITKTEYGSEALTATYMSSSDYFLVGSRPSTRLEVMGQELTYANAPDILPGGDTAGKVSFDFETNTLTLNDVTLNKTVSGPVIEIEYTSQDLTIELIDTNTLTPGSGGYATAIYHDTGGEQGRIIIKGSSTSDILNATGKYSAAIYASHGLVIDRATVNATYERTDGGDALSFNGRGDLELKNGATLNATTTSTNDGSHAIGSFGSITINDGSTLNATTINGYGIHNFNGPIAINNGTIVAMATGTGTTAQAFNRPPNMDTGNSNFSVWAGGSSPGILVSTPDTGVGGTYYEKYVKMTATPHNYSVSISPTSQTQEALVGYDAGAHAMPVTVTNNGSGDLTNVVVTLDGTDVGSFDVTYGGNTVTVSTINVGDLAAGESVTINITPKANLAPKDGYYGMYIKVNAENADGNSIGSMTGGYVHFTVKDMIQSIQVLPDGSSVAVQDSGQGYFDPMPLTTYINGTATQSPSDLHWSIEYEGDAEMAPRSYLEIDGDMGEQIELYVEKSELSGKTLLITAQDPLSGTVGTARVHLVEETKIIHEVTVQADGGVSLPTMQVADYSTVNITAPTPPVGEQFSHWTVTSKKAGTTTNTDTPPEIVDIFNFTTGLLLELDEEAEVVVTAHYRIPPVININSVEITNPQSYLRQGASYDYEVVVDAPDDQYHADNSEFTNTHEVAWTLLGVHSSGTSINVDTGLLTIADGETNDLTIRATSDYNANRFAQLTAYVHNRASILGQVVTSDGTPLDSASFVLTKTSDGSNVNVSKLSGKVDGVVNFRLVQSSSNKTIPIPNGQYTLTVSTSMAGYESTSKTVTIAGGEGQDFFGDDRIVLRKEGGGGVDSVQITEDDLATPITTPPTVLTGRTHTFYGTAIGTGLTDATVTWSVEGSSSASSGTSIDPYTGILSVAPDELATSLTVRATANADSSFSDTQTVNLHKLGDANGDNAVDANDVTVLLRHTLKVDVITDLTRLSSVDVDGVVGVNANDVTRLLRYTLKVDNLV